MASVPFKYYLHDSYGRYELSDFIREQTGVELTEDQLDYMGRPFYEVTLKCELNTETGEVTILGVGE